MRTPRVGDTARRWWRRWCAYQAGTAPAAIEEVTVLFQLTPNEGDAVCMFRETRDAAIEAAQVLADRRVCAVRVYLYGGPAEHVYMGTVEPRLPAIEVRVPEARASRRGNLFADHDSERMIGGPHEVADQYTSEPPRDPRSQS